MTKIITEEPSFNGVGAGQTATINMTIGPTYDKLVLVVGTGAIGGPNLANVIAMIEEIRIKVNAKVQRRMTAAELIAINAYHGKAFRDGHLCIYLAQPWSRTAQGEDVLGWGTNDIETFQIEVDIAAGAVGPTLGMISHKRPISRPLGSIVKWRKQNIPVTHTGNVVVSTLDKSNNYYAMHCKSEDFSSVRVLVDNQEIWNVKKEFLEDHYDDYDFTPQAGYTHLDFAATRRTAEGMLVLNYEIDGKAYQVHDFRTEFNMNAANGFDLITEVVGPRD